MHPNYFCYNSLLFVSLIWFYLLCSFLAVNFHFGHIYVNEALSMTGPIYRQLWHFMPMYHHCTLHGKCVIGRDISSTPKRIPKHTDLLPLLETTPLRSPHTLTVIASSTSTCLNLLLKMGCEREKSLIESMLNGDRLQVVIGYPVTHVMRMLLWFISAQLMTNWPFHQ